MGAPIPADKQPILFSESQLNSMEETQDSSSSGTLSTSPWATMFPSGATQEQLKMFIQCFVKDLMAEVKRSDDEHKKKPCRTKKTNGRKRITQKQVFAKNIFGY